MKEIIKSLEKLKLEIFSLLLAYGVLVGFIYNYIQFNILLKFNIFDYMSVNDIIFSWLVDPYIMSLMIILILSILLNLFPYFTTLISAILITAILMVIIHSLNFIYIGVNLLILCCFVFLFKKYFVFCSKKIQLICKIIVIIVIIIIVGIIFHKYDLIDDTYVNGLFLLLIVLSGLMYISLFIRKYQIREKTLKYFIYFVELFDFTFLENKEIKKSRNARTIEKVIDEYNRKLNELMEICEIVSLNTAFYHKLNSLKIIGNKKNEILKYDKLNETIYIKNYKKTLQDLLSNLYKISKFDDSFQKELSFLIIKIEEELNEFKSITELNPFLELINPFLIFLIVPIVFGITGLKLIENDKKNIVQFKLIRNIDPNNETDKMYKLYKLTSNYALVKEVSKKNTRSEPFIVFNNSDISFIKFINIEEVSYCVKEKTKIDNSKFQEFEKSINNIVTNSLNNYFSSKNFELSVGAIVIPQIDSLLDTKLDFTANFDKLFEYNKSNNGIYFKYNGMLIKNKEIYFEEISFSINNEVKNEIKEILRNVKNGNKYIINLEGNADSKGISLENNTIKDNYTLSLARANSVKINILKILAEQNIDVQNIEFNIHGNSNQNLDSKSKHDLKRFVEIDILEFMPVSIDKIKSEN